MSWFQSCDKSWYNGERVFRLKVGPVDGTSYYGVFADGSLVSHYYQKEEEAQSDLDSFINVVTLNQRAPNFWSERAIREFAPPEVTPRVPPNQAAVSF